MALATMYASVIGHNQNSQYNSQCITDLFSLYVA